MSNIYYKVLKHHADAIQRMYGVKWVPQPHHFKLCKQLLTSEVEGFEPYTPEEVIQRLDAYYREEWWQNVKHDFSNFCKHFDKFIEAKEQKPVRRATTYCGKCGTTHSINDPCVEQRDVQKLIGSIARKVE